MVDYSKFKKTIFAKLFSLDILESKMSLYSHGFATALFSFLYHLASYEAGNMKILLNINSSVLVRLAVKLFVVFDRVGGIKGYSCLTLQWLTMSCFY